MVNLVKAKEEDLHEVIVLAKIIWNEHYVPIIGQDQVDYMLANIYNIESLQDQLNNKKHVFYLIKDDLETIGFLSINSENQRDYFLHKFYIQTQTSNQGIGTKILNELIQLTKAKTLTLTVNRQNYKSINFYFKNGFKIDRVEDFDIGNGYQMNDFVMKKIV